MIEVLRVITTSHEQQLVFVLPPITSRFLLVSLNLLWVHLVSGVGGGQAEQTIRWLRVPPPETGG